MSKMTVPTMDVVRFKENDVIVASGPIDGILLGGFNNGTAEDATVDGYHIYDFVNIIIVTHSHNEVYFRYNGNDAVRAEDLLIHEEDNSLRDGIYTRSEDGDRVMWTWQSQ